MHTTHTVAVSKITTIICILTSFLSHFRADFCLIMPFAAIELHQLHNITTESAFGNKKNKQYDHIEFHSSKLLHNRYN